MKSPKGSILIASPGLVDPNFRRTVVLVTEHTGEGSFGLVLNRPGKSKVAELWAAISDTPCTSEALAFIGGPVQPGSVFVLHTCADLAGEAEPVIPGLYLGSDQQLLGNLLERDEDLRKADKTREIFRVFCGYSGWGEGQLEGELDSGSWLVQPAVTGSIFDTPPAEMWSHTMECEGGLYRIFGLMPPEPELN